jgi:anti-sigma factor RsiW
MRCAKATRQLQLYLDHRLTLSQVRTLEAHLSHCNTCREELRLLEEITQALQNIPPVAEPADLTATIMQRVALTPQRKKEYTYALLRPSLPEILAVVVLATLTTLGIILEQPALRAVLPFADGYEALSQTFTHLVMSVSSGTFTLALWVVGTLLGVCITLALAGGEMRAQWWKAMTDRLPVW